MPLPTSFEPEKVMRVTRADTKRLAPHLTGWNKLCTILASGLLTEDDLKRMIIIEAETLKRQQIMYKLIGAYCSAVRLRVIRKFYPV